MNYASINQTVHTNSFTYFNSSTITINICTYPLNEQYIVRVSLMLLRVLIYYNIIYTILGIIITDARKKYLWVSQWVRVKTYKISAPEEYTLRLSTSCDL